MQVDTGSLLSIVTRPTYAQHRRHWPKLDTLSFQLTCFLRKLPVKGQLQVLVTYAGKIVNATLVVLGCSGPNLCGRDITQAFQLTGGPVLNVDVSDGQLRYHFEGQPPTPSDRKGEVSTPTNVNADPRAGFPCTSPIPLQIKEHKTAPAASGVPEEHDTCTENNEPQANTLCISTRRRKAPDRF
ncbi:hypothetical protein HPB50_009564 [Hyalomma asiaticum]|uniref:Uncharacterized protein n=1 Tax=Hyalomma asiaticum TaxID=266040 RepID=A0ACB7TLF4_HYAAI|nr:hypothetical protein HPB50_009564 [Hyalomma asiaticum]